MADNDKTESNVNILKEPAAETTETTEANNADNKTSKTAEPMQGPVKRSRGFLHRVGETLQVAGTVLKGATATTAGATTTEAPKPAPEPVAEPVEETAKSADAVTEAAKWARRRDIPLAILAWTVVVILFLWLIGHVITTILLLVIAALLAYALAPAVGILQRVMPRFLAIIIVYLLVLGGLGGLVYLIIITAINQASSLSHYLSVLLTPGKNGHPSQLEQILNSLGISSSQIASIRDQLITRAEALAGNALPILSGIVSTVVDIILVAILSIYLLVDGQRITNWLRRNMPRRQSGRVRFLLNTLQRIVGGYIRGQLLLSSLIGVLVGVGMAIIGVPYALLLGVMAFVLEFIPILGVLISGSICVLLALTKGWIIALIVLAYFVGVHVLEGDVVGPRIVGRAVGLHPIVAIAALIAGGELFGIWGVLLASPVAGVLQAFLIALWSEWRAMHPQEFQAAKEKMAQKVEENVADKPVGPGSDSDSDSEPEAKLL